MTEPEYDLTIEELESLGKALVRATELPDVFVAKIVNYEFREDRRGRKALFLRLELEDGKPTIIKYTTLHLSFLAHAFKHSGIQRLSEAVGKTFQWKKEPFQIGFPRPLPVRIVEQKKQK